MAFFESTSAPSSPLSSGWTFFVNSFLSSANAVVPAPDIHLLNQGSVSYLYHLQILLFNLEDAAPSDNVLLSSSALLLNLRNAYDNILFHNNDDGNNNDSFSCTGEAHAVTVLKLTQHPSRRTNYSDNEHVLLPFENNNKCDTNTKAMNAAVTLMIYDTKDKYNIYTTSSTVADTTTNTIIDHRGVLYLIFLQTLFYNQHYNAQLSYTTGANNEDIYAFMMKTISYDLYARVITSTVTMNKESYETNKNPLSSNNDSNNITVSTYVIIMLYNTLCTRNM